MIWPLDLPEKFSDCTSVKEPEELLRLLTKKPDENVIEFLEWISIDEIWCARHSDYIKVILKWLGKEFLANRLQLDYAKRIAQVIYRHEQTFKESLPEDIQFQVEGKQLPAYSLLYGAESSTFLEYLRRYFQPNETLKIPLVGINFSTLLKLNEYINTQRVSKLAESPLEDLSSLMRQAQKWHLNGLSEQIVAVWRHYITRDNVAEVLVKSYREGHDELLKSAFEFIAKLNIGISFQQAKKKGLSLEITRLTEDGLKVISVVKDEVTYLTCSDRVLQDFEFPQLLIALKNLYGIDLSNSRNVSEDVLDVIPPIEELNIRNCVWLDRQGLELLVSKCPGISHLNIADNDHFDYAEIRSVAKFSRLLVLDARNIRGFEDVWLNELTLGCPGLYDFALTDAQRITDVGIVNFAAELPHLTHLDISECHRITEEGFVAMISSHPNFISLTFRRCKGVTDNVVVQVLKQCLELRYFDISLCPLEHPEHLPGLRKSFPYVDLRF